MENLSIRYQTKDDLLPLSQKVAQHVPSKILLQIFCGATAPLVLTTLLAELANLCPKVAIIGASSAGEVINAQVMEQTVVINATFFANTTVRTALVAQNDDIESAAKILARTLNAPSPQGVIAFGCGLRQGNFTNDQLFLETLYQELGNVPIAGGQAAGSEGLKSPVNVFTQKDITPHGYVAAALYGPDITVQTDYTMSWMPIGKSMTITKTEGDRVISIDHKSINTIYEQYLGIQYDASFLHLINHFPLMTERKGLWITNPIAKVYPDGSFDSVQRFHTGDQVRFSFCDVGRQQEEARKVGLKIQAIQPEVVFVYSCESRKIVFGKDIVADMEALEFCTHSVGFFTFGEYVTPGKGTPLFMQQTMTILCLSETSEAPHKHKGQCQFRTPGIDVRRYRILLALNHLVASTTKELEETNKELAELANVDGLTKLANRRLFDQRLLAGLKDNSRSGAKLSLILLDVDYFKPFNDMYGHVTGDDCLRGIAQVLRTTMRRLSDTAFRYGGEEFACILSNTGQEGALQVAENIRQAVMGLNIPHAGSLVHSHVTVSIGVLTLGPDNRLAPQEAISACDALLYRAKDQGRNRIISKECTGDDK